MYYLYIRDGVTDGVGHFHLVGIFPPSYYWSTVAERTVREYGKNNVTYSFHI